MSFHEHCVRAIDRAGVVAHDEEQRRVLGLSDFLCRLAQRDTSSFQSFLDNKTYETELSPALVRARVEQLRAEFPVENASRADMSVFQRAVRRLRYEVQQSVVWRHLAGRATLEETVAALSTMADELLGVALDWCEAALARVEGVPVNDAGEQQRLVVFALGKLGGAELNLSSDIDLICAYSEPGKTSITGKTSQQYFVTLTQMLLKALGETTGDGFGFRIDLRLRPYGDSGPIVQSFAAMERYFETSGRDWERYALIKARACAGDTQAGAELLERLRPFVYRRYLDFAAIDAMRDMRALIRRDQSSHSNNVKLGAGGIRDVEFLAQMLQMIWGGRVVSLRTNSLAEALAALVDEKLLEAQDRDALWRAYKLFRNVEHCLQAFRDEQTHLLPESPEERERLAIAMRFESFDKLETELRAQQAVVLACIAKWLEEEPAEKAAGSGANSDTKRVGDGTDDDRLDDGLLLWRAVSDIDDGPAGVVGFVESVPGRSLQVLIELRAVALRNPEGVVLERVDALMPKLLEDLLAAAGVTTPIDEALLRLEVLLKNVLRRSAYLVLLSESENVRGELARLALRGSYFTDLLAKHPALLEELFQRVSVRSIPQESYSQEEMYSQLQKDLSAELAVLFPAAVADDLQQQHFDLLAQYKSQHQFRALLALSRGDLSVMQLADYLTCLAESVIGVVVEWAWRAVAPEPEVPLQNFVVLGYGKLGGFELGVGSDLDVVLLHNWDLAEHRVLHQLARRVLSYLAVHTYFGQLYEVDIRLRPAGRDGTMASSLEGFTNYQKASAWLWEHQALVRARPVAGCVQLAESFGALRRQILATPRNRQDTRAQIVEMRERMRKSIPAKDAASQLKQGPGGIVDIEFMVQYLVLGWASEFPSLLDFTDNARLLEQASATGVLAENSARHLIEDYAALRHSGQLLAIGYENGQIATTGTDTDAHTLAQDIEWRQERVARVWQELMVTGRSPDTLAPGSVENSR